LTFPLFLKLRRPGPRDIGENFEGVRNWIKGLEEGPKASGGGVGYVIGWETINHRQLGRNRLPATISIATRDDALIIIGKKEDAHRFDCVRELTAASLPALMNWLERKPLTALEHAASWDRMLKVLLWFQIHTRPDIYLRQLDIPGVDTKFVESRRGLVAELLEEVLPGDQIRESGSGGRDFETRFGFRTKPKLIRFRVLDPCNRKHGWTDISVPLPEFAASSIEARRIFITENEINGITFPQVKHGIVVFGAGYAVEQLSLVTWLGERDVFYWGDIDTHGFAMLDKLRASLPGVSSLLMDREILLAHRELWSVEDVPFVGNLNRLSVDEEALFDDLRFNRIGQGVRLEQERVSYGRLQAALDRIVRP
jgi:hypothetical protein